MKLKRLWLPFGLAILTISIAYAGDSPDGGFQRSSVRIDQGHSNVIGTTENMLASETEKGTTRGLTVKSTEIDGATKPKPGGDSQRSSSTLGDGHRNVIGTISKTTENMLTLETDQGTTRNFTVKSANVDGVTKLKPGDRVLLELDEGNQIIGINDLGAKHELVHGEVVGIDRNKKIVTLKLKNGTSQSYGMKEAMAGKMNSIEKGAVVTLMIDQHNNLAMDVHVD